MTRIRGNPRIRRSPVAASRPPRTLRPAPQRYRTCLDRCPRGKNAEDMNNDESPSLSRAGQRVVVRSSPSRVSRVRHGERAGGAPRGGAAADMLKMTPDDSSEAFPRVAAAVVAAPPDPRRAAALTCAKAGSAHRPRRSFLWPLSMIDGDGQVVLAINVESPGSAEAVRHGLHRQQPLPTAHAKSGSNCGTSSWIAHEITLAASTRFTHGTAVALGGHGAPRRATHQPSCPQY